MNIRNLIKKMILIFGVIGISLTAFAAPRRNNKVVYVKKEPSRKVIVRRRYIFVKVPKKKRSYKRQLLFFISKLNSLFFKKIEKENWKITIKMLKLSIDK